MCVAICSSLELTLGVKNPCRRQVWRAATAGVALPSQIGFFHIRSRCTQTGPRGCCKTPLDDGTRNSSTGWIFVPQGPEGNVTRSHWVYLCYVRGRGDGHWLCIAVPAGSLIGFGSGSCRCAGSWCVGARDQQRISTTSPRRCFCACCGMTVP